MVMSLAFKKGLTTALFGIPFGLPESIDAIRFIESHAAKVYWKAWKVVPVIFPDKDMPRVPGHWLNFGSRVSPLSGSPRLAANPVNAILNYLYALLEQSVVLLLQLLGLIQGWESCIWTRSIETAWRAI
jgi:CRISPR/Cas system-associated endonuclease Cas1